MANETVSPPPPARRRRFGWLRVLGIIFGVLLVLLVAGYFIATSSAFFKGVILPRVSKAMNAQVTVADASVSPFSRVILKDLQVRTTGADPLFSAAEVRLRYSLMKAIGGNILVEEAALESPTVILVENPDGSSNLDPILKSQQSVEQTQQAGTDEAGKEEPMQIDIRKISLSNGTIRMLKLYQEGTRDVTELTKANLTVENVKNGQTGKMTLGADLRMQSNPPAPNTNGTLQARLDGDFSFVLGPDLMPTGIKGSSHFQVVQAGGAYATASGLNAALESDVTPTEVRQVTVRFAKENTPLGQLLVRGPFDMQKIEGRLFAELTGVDKQLFNVAGGPMGIDFGSTTLRATNELQIAQAGYLITAGGQLDTTGFQVIRTNQATPPLDLRAAYSVTVDLNKSNAILSGLTLNGVQRGMQILRGELASPMNISWGGAAGNVGDSTLTVVLTNLNLADWKAFAPETDPSGSVAGQLRLVSQEGGNRLTYDLTSRVDNLAAAAGTNRFSNLRVDMQVSGTASNLTLYSLREYRLDVRHEAQPLLVGSGSATYSLDTSSADAQLQGSLFLDRAIRLMPMPDLALNSGAVQLQARIQQKGDDLSVVGSSTLTNLQGRLGTTEFRGFAASANIDLAMNSYQVQIRKAEGTLSEGGRTGGSYNVSGTYNLTNSAAQLTARLSDVNQNGLRPFLEAALSEKTLVSVSLNGEASVQYQPEGASSFRAQMRMANLVVNDPKNPALATPLDARMGLDASMNKQVLEIRQAELGFTPTARATNVVQLTGRIDLSDTNAYTGNLKLAAQTLDVTRYYDLFQGAEGATAQPQTPVRPAPAPAPSAAAPPGPEEEMEPISMPLTNFVTEASVGKLFLHEVEITNFQSNIRVNGGRVVINPFQMAMNGAPVKSTMDLDFGIPGYKYDLGFSAAQLPLAPIVNTFQPERRGQVGGTLTGQGSITGAGTTGASLKRNLRGNFDIGTTNLNLAIPSLRSPLLKSIINVIAVVPDIIKNPNSALGSLTGALFGSGASRQSGGLMDDLMQNPLDVIQARGKIGNGRIDLEDSLVQSPAFQARAKGTILLNDILTNSTLNIPLTVSLQRSLAEKINFVPAGTPTNVVYVKLPDYVAIEGTLGEPKSKINKMALAGTVLQQLGTSIPGMDQKTGSLLQNLGGVLTGRTGASGTNAPPTGTNPPASGGNLLQGLGSLLGGPQSSTNAPPRQGQGSLTTNAPAQSGRSGQGKSSGANLLQSILGGLQGTNAPAATNAPGTKRSGQPSGSAP